LVPARVKGRNIFIKHALKQTNRTLAVTQYKPALTLLSMHLDKTQLRIKCF